jgi:hypothetical protein
MAFGVGAVRRRVALGPMGVFGLAVLAAGLYGFAASPVVVLSLASLALAGVGFLLALTALTTELQRRVPEVLLGRVMALWTVAFLGSRPVAALMDGALADAFGPRTAAAVAATLTAGVAVWVHRARRASGFADGARPLGSDPTQDPAASPPTVSG